MEVKTIIFIHTLFLMSLFGFSQNDTISRIDTNGLKIGYWEISYWGADSILYGKGFYKNGCQVGEWNYYYENGNPKSKFFYVNGSQRRGLSQRKGDYEKYYPNGCLMEKGSLGSCIATAGMERREVICNEGEVTMYYKDSCNALMYRRMFKSGRQVWIIKYDRTGTPSDTIFYENYFRQLETVSWQYETIKSNWENDTSAVEDREIIVNSYDVMSEEDIADGGINYSGGVSKNGSEIKLNGYNKVYNKDGELWLDGEFKYGYLYHGKHYLYNEDGMLLKIEVWKNGKYHSDGQL